MNTNGLAAFDSSKLKLERTTPVPHLQAYDVTTYTCAGTTTDSSIAFTY